MSSLFHCAGPHHQIIDCPRCATTCESCGRSAEERVVPHVLCDGLCRECIEQDYLFDAELCGWVCIDDYGECADCDREEPLFSVGDGLVCLGCLRAIRQRRDAA